MTRRIPPYGRDNIMIRPLRELKDNHEHDFELGIGYESILYKCKICKKVFNAKGEVVINHVLEK